ncbi:DUF1624 domain-containing protein [Candidatus Micrarchaeota archaeon]|nr:DUF1624 domain-containing protein [Candidatus Micrarchaeota archaeon]
MRVKGIDTFRGLSIVLMVFFSLIMRLSDKLPDCLIHNVDDSLHLGDFVLPMFLFASGMSLVFFAKKREKKKKIDYYLDVVERFGKLVLISLFLTPFSAGEMLGMDEVMLSAVLFLITIVLLGFSEIIIVAVGIVVVVAYLILQQIVLLPDFSAYYLGGYSAALFYLPVMLAGVIAGKRMKELGKVTGIAVIISVLLFLVVPPYKMVASPSFMMLSVVLSLLGFALVKDLEIEQLEYLGRKPIRYWVLMFVVLLIPIGFYGYLTSGSTALGFEWPIALILSLLCLPLLYLMSRGIDFVHVHLKQIFNHL